MSDKASGNNEEKRDLKRSGRELAGPEGEEISLDPESGDLLDPVERWWNEDIVEDVPSEDSESGEGVSSSKEDEESDPQEETSSVVVPPEAIKPLTPLVPDEDFEEEEEIVPEVDSEEKGPKPVEKDLEPEPIPPEEDEEDEALAGEKAEELEEESRDSEEGESEHSDEEEISEEEESGEAEEEEESGEPIDVESGKDEEGEEAGEDEVDELDEGEASETEDGSDGEEFDKEEEDSEDDSDEGDDEDSDEGEESSEEEDSDDDEEELDEEDSDEEVDSEKDDASDGEEDPDSSESADAETIVAAEGIPAKRKAGCWTIFLNLFFFSSLAVFVALAVGALWVWSKLSNLEYEVMQRVRPALAEQGIYFEYEGWKYQYPRGLVIEGITLFETEKLERPVLTASDLGVNVDFLSIIRDRSTPTSVDVSFDDSVLTFFQEAQEVGSISRLTGELFASREEVEIEGLSARVEGLDVSVSGDIQLPEGKSGEGEPAEATESEEKQSFALDLTPMAKALPWLQVESEEGPPVLDLDFSIDAGALETAELSASLSGRNFRWQEVPFTSVSIIAGFEPATKTIQFSTFQLGYGDGIIGGTLAVDLEEQMIAIEQIQSTVDLLALASDLDAEAEEALSDLAFVDAPNVKVSGSMPMSDPKLARLEVNYDHRQGLIYSGGGRTLPVRDLRGSFAFNQGILETNDFAGKVLEGNVAINGSVRLTAEGTPFSGLVQVSSLPLAKVGEYYGKGDLGMTGDIFFDFRGIGYSEITKVRGGGSIRVDGARLPAFPVIGPVQKFLGAVVPAFGIQGEGSLSGAYIIESGTLLTNDLTVAQAGAQLVTNGSLNLETQSVSFTTKASLQPTLAKATGMEDKTIEVSGEGELTSPNLSLSWFPVDFAAGKLSEVLGTSPESLGQLKGMISGGEAAAEIFGAPPGTPLGEAIGEELGGEVRGLFEGIFGGGEPEVAPETPTEGE